MQYCKSLFLSASGQVQRQFLQGRVMSHHHDIPGVAGEFA